MTIVKNFSDFKKKRKLNEGWIGAEANEARDEMIMLFDNISGEAIVDSIWDFFDSNDIKMYYEFLKDEHYM